MSEIDPDRVLEVLRKQYNDLRKDIEFAYYETSAYSTGGYDSAREYVDEQINEMKLTEFLEYILV